MENRVMEIEDAWKDLDASFFSSKMMQLALEDIHHLLAVVTETADKLVAYNEQNEVLNKRIMALYDEKETYRSTLSVVKQSTNIVEIKNAVKNIEQHSFIQILKKEK